ncbi:MAG TPA: TRAP transporter small permease [Burkholderiales bacterium]|nr:TRAP transporter small permease [Burkholderiales bacterium]
MDRVSALYGKLLEGLALVACALLFLMMLMICADVLLRNVPMFGLRGIDWSNEVSEGMLYLITMMAAPWLLRRGQHIRVDILLRAIPPRLAWLCEWVCDALAFGCCLVMVWYGAHMAAASRAAGSLSIKTLVTPEWWLLAPLPIAFALLAVEVLFRMRRLYYAERAPRADAVSAS